MPATYEKIQSTTLGSVASSITFNSISSAYTDLRLVLFGRGSGYIYPNATFNSDTGANYSITMVYGEGTNALSLRGTNNNNLSWSYYGTNKTALYTLDIFSYAGSTYKTVLGTANEDDNGGGSVGYSVNLWRSTSAITRIDLSGGGNNFAIGTTATLYGILKA